MSGIKSCYLLLLSNHGHSYADKWMHVELVRNLNLFSISRITNYSLGQNPVKRFGNFMAVKARLKAAVGHHDFAY
jgi:hypothetical protein